MRKIIVVASWVTAAYAFAQTCITAAPVVPPIPTQATVTLPADGGTVGCTFTAFVAGGAPAANYVVGNAKCATMVGMAKQAAANDNGWNDGGVP